MFACICRQFGSPDALAVEEIAAPTPATGEAQVKIAAASVNFPDLLMVAGRYQVKPPLPFIPGLEFSGIVSALAEDVQGWRIGDRVMGAPSLGGSFAEYICMPADRLFRVPEEVEFPLESAAGLLIAHGTAGYSLKQRGQLQSGETVLITGAAGGVGAAAVEIAQRMGARVIAAAGSAEKVATALAHGANEGIDYGSTSIRDAVMALTGKRGVDLMIDMVGGAVFDDALRSVARWGRVVVVGFASGEIPRIRAEYLLIKNISVIGAGFGATLAGDGDAALARTTIADLLSMNRICPLHVQIENRLPLGQVPQALQLLADRKVKGKLLIIPRGA